MGDRPHAAVRRMGTLDARAVRPRGGDLAACARGGRSGRWVSARPGAELALDQPDRRTGARARRGPRAVLGGAGALRRGERARSTDRRSVQHRDDQRAARPRARGPRPARELDVAGARASPGRAATRARPRSGCGAHARSTRGSGRRASRSGCGSRRDQARARSGWIFATRSIHGVARSRSKISPASRRNGAAASLRPFAASHSACSTSVHPR